MRHFALLRVLRVLLAFLAFLSGAAAATSSIFDHGPLKLTVDRRALEHQDGTPFLFLADTAWMLLLQTTPAESDRYLAHRAAHGYGVVLTSLWCFNDQDLAGRRVFLNGDLGQPNPTYFAAVDAVLDQAEALGLYVALNPAWGNSGLGGKVSAFSINQATAYGTFLGNRYKDRKNLIWFIGGDSNGNKSTYQAMLTAWRAAGAAQLVTWHPDGGTSCTQVYPNDDATIDFNVCQTGHYRTDIAPTLLVADYARTPIKPIMNWEPNYEDHPINWNASSGFFTGLDARKQAYWSLFSGAGGHAYGHHAIWSFYTPARGMPASFFSPPKDSITWEQALDRPGSLAMAHIRTLLTARGLTQRVPDQLLISADQGEGATLVTACRAADRAWALLYLPSSGQSVTVDLARHRASQVQVWWYDPRSGQSHDGGRVSGGAPRAFTSPAQGEDWILVLDDAADGLPPPGSSDAPSLSDVISQFGRSDSAINLPSADVNRDGRVDATDLRQVLP